MQIYLETEFWICHIRKVCNAKNGVTLIVMIDATFSDHTIVIIWKFMTSVWHRMWVVWHTIKWSYICSIILLKYWTGFLGIPKSTLFLPCATMCIIRRSNVLYCCQLPNGTCTQIYNIKSFVCEMICITKYPVTFNTYARNLISTTEWNLQ
jgi:hypothetical protein